jgi:hypothetical protein
MTEGMDRLQFMVGEWDIQAYIINEFGEWIESPLPKKTVIKSVFDGAFLQEDEVLMMAGEHRVRFFIMWSYDQYRQIYRMFACDDQEGLADILEGGYEESGDKNTITVSNIKTGTAIQDGKGQSIYLRLASTQIGNDAFTDVMSESTDNGKSWTPVYRAIHTRKR